MKTLVTLYLEDAVRLEMKVGSKIWVDGADCIVERVEDEKKFDCEGCALKDKNCWPIECTGRNRNDRVTIYLKNDEKSKTL